MNLAASGSPVLNDRVGMASRGIPIGRRADVTLARWPIPGRYRAVPGGRAAAAAPGRRTGPAQGGSRHRAGAGPGAAAGWLAAPSPWCWSWLCWGPRPWRAAAGYPVGRRRTGPRPGTGPGCITPPTRAAGPGPVRGVPGVHRGSQVLLRAGHRSVRRRPADPGRITGRPDQGGATLYQQLAKMLYTPGRSGLAVEAEQVSLGIKLDLAYPKPQILRMYADVAYFGHGYYGLARGELRLLRRHAGRAQLAAGGDAGRPGPGALGRRPDRPLRGGAGQAGACAGPAGRHRQADPGAGRQRLPAAAGPGRRARRGVRRPSTP